MRVETVSDDLHIVIGETYASNSTVFVRGNDALLVDALGSTSDAQEFCAWLDSRRLTVRVIVQTHYFSDHMAALRFFPDAVLIAHRACDETFAREQFRSEEEAGFYVAPTMRLDGAADIRWGRYTLRLLSNPGHTESTLNIDVPEADLLFTSDNVVSNIFYFRYSDVNRAAASLSRLSAIGRSRIVTSHEGVRSADAIANAAHYVNAFARGLRDEEVAKFLPAGVVATEADALYHRRNIAG
jgi:cyclase